MRNTKTIQYKDGKQNHTINFILDDETTDRDVIRYVTYDDTGIAINNISMWDKELAHNALKYLKAHLEYETREIKVDDTFIKIKTANMVYVPIYNNGKVYRGNHTYPPEKVFKSRKTCVEWIESQKQMGHHYKYDKERNVWNLQLDNNNPDYYKVYSPNGFYKICCVELVEW